MPERQDSGHESRGGSDDQTSSRRPCMSYHEALMGISKGFACQIDALRSLILCAWLAAFPAVGHLQASGPQASGNVQSAVSFVEWHVMLTGSTIHKEIQETQVLNSILT